MSRSADVRDRGLAGECGGQAREAAGDAGRGPDDEGLWWSGDGRVGLADRRLAIIDLSPAGRQPMADAADMEALNRYFVFGCARGERSMLRGIWKLPQGHALAFDVDSGTVRAWAYWLLSSHDPSETATNDDLDEYDRLLADIVRLRLIADVPLGVMLSGSVDASLVVAIADRASWRVKTLMLSFPGQGSFDEAPFARQVARHPDTDHIEPAAEPAVDLLQEMARQYDDPIVDSSMVPTYVVSRLIRHEATVAFAGDGGDDHLFGGYTQRSWVQQDRLGRWIPSPLRRVGQAAASRVIPIGTKVRNYLLTVEPPYNLVQSNLIFDHDVRRQPPGPAAESLPCTRAPEASNAALCTDRAIPLQQSTAPDLRRDMVDDVLTNVDPAGMHCAHEVRTPFVDTRLIAPSFRRLPDRLRATARDQKILSRRPPACLLSSGLGLTRTQSLSLPLASCFKGHWGQFVEDVLTAPQADLLDWATGRQMLKGQRMEMANVYRLFTLTMVELRRRDDRVSRVAAAEASGWA